MVDSCCPVSIEKKGVEEGLPHLLASAGGLVRAGLALRAVVVPAWQAGADCCQELLCACLRTPLSCVTLQDRWCSKGQNPPSSFRLPDGDATSGLGRQGIWGLTVGFGPP